MSPIVRIWPKDTHGQLREFRANLRVLFLVSFISPCIVIFPPHHFTNVNENVNLLAIAILLTSLLSTWISIARPISPFRKGISVPTPPSELDDYALRVLSFLQSPKAITITRLTGFIVALLLIFVMVLYNLIIRNGLPTDWNIELDFNTIVFLFSQILLLFFFVWCAQLTVLHTWIVKNINHIISSCKPWPKDKEFEKTPLFRIPPDL